MSALLSIGDFARATQLSVKTLRHYHASGLLPPAAIDRDSGYRRYGTDQIPTAQAIRRFRDLDMPLDLIRAVLAAPDLTARNELIATHLQRLENDLARTRGAVASLRELLESGSETPIIHRTVPASLAAVISDVIDIRDASHWFDGAMGELRVTLVAQGIDAVGPAGGVYSNAFFEDEQGLATVFIPIASVVTATGRVVLETIPAVELATTIHSGPAEGIDRAYGALGAYVTEQALAGDGPIREYYVFDKYDTTDESAWRTEVGWPIAATAGRGSRPA